MSVNPLPVLNAASTARSPQPADSTPRAASHRESPAFGTQLQDARRRQSDAAHAHSKPDDARSDKPTPSAATASKSAVPNPSKTNRQSSLTESDKPADPPVDSPASSVLGLIGQSSQSPDANAGATAKTAVDAKAASDKTPPDNATPSLPMLPTVATIVPTAPLSSQDSAQSADDANAADTCPQVAVASSGALNAALAGPTGSAAATDESDDADTGAASNDGGDASGVTSATAFVLNAASPDPMGASHLFAADHAALSGLDPAVADAGNQTRNSGDAAVLGMIVNTSPPAAPAVGSAVPHSLNLGAPINSPTFSQELGQQVAWLSGQTVKQAQIRLNPQELGQIDVKLSVEHGRVDVAFMAQHPAAVVAVQHSLDQLNQMLGGHGLSLGQTSVGQQAMQHPSGSPHGQPSTGSTGADHEADQAPAAAPMSPVIIGLLDTFA